MEENLANSKMFMSLDSFLYFIKKVVKIAKGKKMIYMIIKHGFSEPFNPKSKFWRTLVSEVSADS